MYPRDEGPDEWEFDDDGYVEGELPPDWMGSEELNFGDTLISDQRRELLRREPGEEDVE